MHWATSHNVLKSTNFAAGCTFVQANQTKHDYDMPICHVSHKVQRSNLYISKTWTHCAPQPFWVVLISIRRKTKKKSQSIFWDEKSHHLQKKNKRNHNYIIILKPGKKTVFLRTWGLLWTKFNILNCESIFWDPTCDHNAAMDCPERILHSNLLQWGR